MKAAVAKHDPSSHDAQHQKVQRLASNLWSEAHQKEKDRSSCQVRKKRGLIQLKYTNFLAPVQHCEVPRISSIQLQGAHLLVVFSTNWL